MCITILISIDMIIRSQELWLLDYVRFLEASEVFNIRSGICVCISN